MDNDDIVRAEARATLDALWDRYWAAKKATAPPTSHDDYFDLRVAYEDAAAAYAALEGRLLRDAILSSAVDVAGFRQVRADLQTAMKVRETIAVALKFVQLMAKLA